MLVFLKESNRLVLPTLVLNWCEDYVSSKDVIIGRRRRFLGLAIHVFPICPHADGGVF